MKPLAIDDEKARTFLRELAPEDDVFTFGCCDDLASRRDPRLSSPPLRGSLDACLPTLAWRQAAGCGVFVAVNDVSRWGLAARYVTKIRALVADDDRPEDWPIWGAPDIVTETAPGRFCCFWRPSGRIAVEDFAEFQTLLGECVNGAPTVRDAAVRVRLPGTLNFENPNNPFRVKLVKPALACAQPEMRRAAGGGS